MPYKKKISKDKIREMVDYYEANPFERMAVISRMFGYENSTFSKILKRNSIPTRKSKYKLCEDYFDNIDSEEKAYFLGFLYADGSNTGKQICLKLHSNDIDILRKLGNLIYRSDFKITHSYDSNAYMLVMSSRYLCNSLTKQGCHKNKTFTLSMPTINKDLIRHFIRGYFDGDGSIIESKLHTEFMICGASKHFVEQIHDIICEETFVNKRKLYCKTYDKTQNSVYYIRICGINNVNKVFKYLYKDSNIYMERKYRKFREILNKRGL